ncbi:hypothetical protein [Stakelama tenebrarum]|uniref:Glycine zipper family protein n=1 Tax=Stakelama tenebrarum TaxID=2711215 RepID=A0A6G6Y951_9SPHN|nr:hypothetical protein [Sphingosinithalassobacter tenebrarum]QIG81096.1 hypothetical protein G5C33_15765 [Sphingosinithalassobacter tenebrarum]
MSNESKTPTTMAGGFPIFAGIFLGAIFGVVAGQPSLGIMAGFALGAATAIVIWLRDRQRKGS